MLSNNLKEKEQKKNDTKGAGKPGSAYVAAEIKANRSNSQGTEGSQRAWNSELISLLKDDPIITIGLIICILIIGIAIGGTIHPFSPYL